MGNRRKGRKRRVPLGKPLPKTTDDTAVISEEDIERAKEAWRKYVPARYRDLLDAEIDSGDEFE